jgi:hypothetical protein
MVTHVLADKIVSASKFRGELSRWFSIASKQPVTVTNGDNKFTIFNREKFYELFMSRYYLESALKICHKAAGDKIITTFPWLESLDTEEQEEFEKEYINGVLKAVMTDKWNEVEELIEDWKATADTKSNKEAMRAIAKKVRKQDYVTIK